MGHILRSIVLFLWMILTCQLLKLSVLNLQLRFCGSGWITVDGMDLKCWIHQNCPWPSWTCMECDLRERERERNSNCGECDFKQNNQMNDLFFL